MLVLETTGTQNWTSLLAEGPGIAKERLADAYGSEAADDIVAALG